MSSKPEFLRRGEAARLFPVLATTSKEGRATSILLSCMAKVDEFAAAQLKTMGISSGKRTKIECFTEVAFANTTQRDKRPDGLIVVKTSAAKQKYFLVEAKIGKAKLVPAQIENYVRICKELKLDGVVTISNQYASSPDVHPLEEVRKIKTKVPVFHWSWMSLLTTIDLMVSSEEVVDHDQKLIANELRRFLSHKSTGVKGFERMPEEWTKVNKIFSTKGSLDPKSKVTSAIVEAWMQEAKDLCLILSRLTNRLVSEKLPNAHAEDPEIRKKAAIETLVEEGLLEATFKIPDAAAPMKVVADAKRKSVFVEMSLGAPQDKKSSRARLNWLLRQMKGQKIENCHVRTNWPGSSSSTTYPVAKLIENPDLVSQGKGHLTASSFVVFGAYNLRRFEQRRGFIKDLEKRVPEFYQKIGQSLKEWKKSPPKIEESAESVDVDAIAREADDF